MRVTRSFPQTILLLFALLHLSRSIVSATRRMHAVHVKKRSAKVAFQTLREIVQGCDALEHMDSLSDPIHNRSTHDTSIDALLSLTDATFVLSTHSCASFSSHVRWVCVKGEKIDSCVPKRLGKWIEKHGYATSISHAFIFMYGISRGYQHVTIIEDDAVLSTTVRRELIEDVRNVLRGPDDAWTFLRLGHRPFFLERQHKLSSEAHLDDPFKCPSLCACTKIGTHACRMTENGCDMRSSHFYIANANVFRQVIEYLLDVSDEHRIIDWFVLHRFPNQIYADYPIAMQAALDMPVELQEGYAKLFKRLCVH